MKCKNLPLTIKLNDFESELGGWTICVFATTTTGLLFYHMTRAKTLIMRPTHAAAFAITLLSCAIVYILYSLKNFYFRTGILLKNKDKCTLDVVSRSRRIYSVVSALVAFTLICICLQIIYNTRTFFYKHGF